MNKSLLIFLFFIYVAFISAEEPSFLKGEKINYNIRWGYITAGTAVLEIVPSTKESPWIKARSTALGPLQWLYPVFDTVYTEMNRDSLYPRYFMKRLNEGDFHNHVEIIFNDITKKARLIDTVFIHENNKRKIKRFSDTTVSIEHITHSITSAFYYIRSLDLKPGTDYFMRAVSGKKKYELKVKCLRYETVTVPSGKFPCIVVEPITKDDGIFKAKGTLTIWLTRDNRKIPVMMKSKIGMGSITAEMTGFK